MPKKLAKACFCDAQLQAMFILDKFQGEIPSFPSEKSLHGNF